MNQPYQFSESLAFMKALMNKTGVDYIYPELSNEPLLFESVLSGSSLLPSTFSATWFEMPFNLMHSDHYNLIWNISAIESFLFREKFPTQRVKVGSCKIHSDPKRLDPYKVNYMMGEEPIDEPIILAYHTPLQAYILIEGNHRYHTALNRKQDDIEAYLLPPNIHTNFMINEMSKNLYVVHHNICLLNNLCVYPIRNKFQISLQLGKHDYYPFTDDLEINFTTSKNIKILFNKALFSLNIKT